MSDAKELGRQMADQMQHIEYEIIRGKRSNANIRLLLHHLKKWCSTEYPSQVKVLNEKIEYLYDTYDLRKTQGTNKDSMSMNDVNYMEYSLSQLKVKI